MYADLNTGEMLVVKRTNNRRHRFLYKVVNKITGAILAQRYSNRKYVAATIDGGKYFARLTQAEVHRASLRADGLSEDMALTYFCYLEDSAAFDTPKNLPAWVVDGAALKPHEGYLKATDTVTIRITQH